ncbi:MAG: helix-turn-helix transcriptional regulator [Myxococcales bacterium]
MADNLRRLRRRRGLSLERLAKASGVSRSMLGQIEQARSTPTVTLLRRIARGLAVPLDALLAEPAPSNVVEPSISVRRSQTFSEDELMGAHWRMLSTPDLGAQVADFHELRMAPGFVEPQRGLSVGTTKHVVVVLGHVSLRVGDGQQSLATGDAASFAPTYRTPIKTRASN